ncbi:hypothetical protein SAMN04488503_2415 [Humidesulfovibrio mexicanus]|uniref:Uncharacterized protein n=1 Tax=Humidesulfovibrio mexicanus TaxID=147047 RepID=A0A239B4U6_9BACT|nr:hypothetical protein [Humidesulfovibrio mexicanus]SNS02601.1 hypothetical protein SAMN04488503_2415 [Humidesulfovibrio mexicanus]
MKNVLILLLLLVPSAAFAELTFDISCDNVANIVIIRGETAMLAQRAPDGSTHTVTFILKPESLRAFQTFIEASRHAQYPRVAEPYPQHPALAITANGKPLQCDMLEIRGYGGKKVVTFIFDEQDAFDAARAVCPTAPVKFMVAPLREPEPAQQPQIKN